MRRLNSVGAGHLLIVAALAVLLGIGFTAYRVAGTPKKAPVNSTSSTQQPVKYKTKADVQNASKQLESTDVDKSLDSSSLDSDLNDLL